MIIKILEALWLRKIKTKESVGAEAAGNVYGNISNAATNYGIDKFSTPRGHGFAAERANHLYDILHGKDSVIAGDNNAKMVRTGLWTV